MMADYVFMWLPLELWIFPVALAVSCVVWLWKKATGRDTTWNNGGIDHTRGFASQVPPPLPPRPDVHDEREGDR